MIPEALASPEHDHRVLPLGDNFATGYHGVVGARVRPGDTVVIVGDGAIGQSTALAAILQRADTVVMIGHHADRLALAVAAVRELTRGRGADAVVDSVGTDASITLALSVARDGATLSVMGVRFLFESVTAPFASAFPRNISIHTGLCPAPAYVPHLLDAVEHGRVDPSIVFTHTLGLGLDDAPRGYEIMNTRESGSIKVALRTRP